MIFGIKVDNLQLTQYWLCNPFKLFLSLKCNISPFSNSNLWPNSYKTDQVGFCGLSLNHSISGLESSNEMVQKPRYRVLNIVIRNICNHDFNYGLVFFYLFIFFLFDWCGFIHTRCTWNHYKVTDDTLESFVADSCTCSSMVKTWTATVYKCPLILLFPLWQMPPWHQGWQNFPVSLHLPSFKVQGLQMTINVAFVWINIST